MYICTVAIKSSSFIYTGYICLFTCPVGDCLGPGFTTTIPAPDERSNYSTTVLGPGGVAIYTALRFTCTGTLESLTFPFKVRGSDNLHWNRYLHVWLTIWRFNGTGYHPVTHSEFRSKQLCGRRKCHRTLQSGEVLQYLGEISTQTEVLANDMVGFRLADLKRANKINIYQHLPLLYKPGPAPGTFIPIVSANVTASNTTSEECMPKYTLFSSM